MFQSVLGALFSCSNRRTTFPLTPGRRGATLAGGARTYVVCLECGKEFAYDWAAMRVGEPVTPRLPATVAHPVFR